MNAKILLTVIHVFFIGLFLASCASNRPLHQASLNGNITEVRKLLSEGVDVNQRDGKNKTPLICAVQGGHYMIAEELLNKEADINAAGGYFGDSPLHMATFSSKQNSKLVSLLISRGANVNSKDRRLEATPLHYAAMNGHVLIVNKLLDAGALIEVHAKDGYTPLHSAAHAGQKDTLKLLLDKGANINSRENSKMTPLHIAIYKQKIDIVNLLIENGADTTIAAKIHTTDGFVTEIDLTGYNSILGFSIQDPKAKIINEGIRNILEKQM